MAGKSITGFAVKKNSPGVKISMPDSPAGIGRCPKGVGVGSCSAR